MEPTQLLAHPKKATWGMGITANKYVAYQYPVPLAGFFMTQCSGFGMFILDPDFYPSRISDPGSNNSTKKGRGKNYLVLPFFVATNVIK
jgi:hypothetical protein